MLLSKREARALPYHVDWQQWTALNRQLMQQWRKLLAADPSLADEPTPPEDAQDKYALLNALGDDVLALFETGKGCVYLSPNWERITGRPAGASLRDGFYEALHPDHRKPFVTALQQAICEDPAQLSLLPQQFRFLHASGTPRWFMLKPGEVRSFPGGRQQLACVLRDMHDALETQKHAREARRETQRAMQARSDFLNAMNHELRTPLNAILGFTQIMESGMYGDISNPQYREYLTHIRESGYELLSQIDEVMEMACADSRSEPLARDICDLHDLLNQALLLHQPQARFSQVTLSCRVAPGFTDVSVDRLKLQHCVSHIIANALRFSRPGGSIDISAEFTANQELCIAVADNGLGMSARKLHQVVNALQKNEEWPDSDPGLGLGLALAREFARLHGGYLTLESQSGSGTRVNIHLPAECVVQKSEKVIPYSAFVL